MRLGGYILGYDDAPFIRSQRLWKLVRELGAAVNIELGQENERTVLGIDAHIVVGASSLSVERVDGRISCNLAPRDRCVVTNN